HLAARVSAQAFNVVAARVADDLVAELARAIERRGKAHAGARLMAQQRAQLIGSWLQQAMRGKTEEETRTDVVPEGACAAQHAMADTGEKTAECLAHTRRWPSWPRRVRGAAGRRDRHRLAGVHA